MIQYLDYLFITRPILFFPGWITLMAGFLAARGDNRLIFDLLSGRLNPTFWNRSLGLTMVSFAAAMGASFILNQLQDVESDQKNKKLFLIGEKYLSRNAAIGESVLLIAISLLLSLFLNWKILLLNGLFVMITGYLYNYPPFQCKNRPYSGLFLNMLMGWIAFALGWTLTANFTWKFILASLPYLFLNTGLYLLTTLPDIDGDRASGKETVGVKFGSKTTMRLFLLLYFAAFLAAAWIGDQLILVVILLALPVVLRLLQTLALSWSIKTTKMAIFFFALLICFKFPTFFLLMVSLFYLTRFYYRRRFQFDYPNFRGE